MRESGRLPRAGWSDGEIGSSFPMDTFGLGTACLK